jgi:cell division protein FtsB
MEAKIEELMSLVRGQSLAETKTMLAESLGRVAKLEEQVSSQQILIDAQDKEILQLKDSVNFLNQQSRAYFIRLLGGLPCYR